MADWVNDDSPKDGDPSQCPKCGDYEHGTEPCKRELLKRNAIRKIEEAKTRGSNRVWLSLAEIKALEEEP
jgi:hypothetical protein